MTDRYRVGRRCPWNIYRVNPTDADRDHDDRFAVAIGPGAPTDGPVIAAALNAYNLPTALPPPGAKPAEILFRAASRIHNTAADATPGPFTAVAPHLIGILEGFIPVALQVEAHGSAWGDPQLWASYRQAMELARAVLGLADTP